MPKAKKAAKAKKAEAPGAKKGGVGNLNVSKSSDYPNSPHEGKWSVGGDFSEEARMTPGRKAAIAKGKG